MSDLDRLKKFVDACHDEAEATNDTIVSGAELDAYLLTVEPARSIATERDRLKLQLDVARAELDVARGERDLMRAEAQVQHVSARRARSLAEGVARSVADRIATWLDDQGTATCSELAVRVRDGAWRPPWKELLEEELRRVREVHVGSEQPVSDPQTRPKADP